METRSGFTLIQLFMVIILCVLSLFAFIAQFTSHSVELINSPFNSDLQAMRSQIEFYKIQHNGDLPGAAADVNFAQALTQKTNAEGSLNPTGRGYGPYMRNIPVNPFNDLDTVEIDGVLGGGDHGWHFNSTTGKFHADDDKHTGR